MEESCYQCHPGTSVQCLRGAMFNGDMLCSDCHGSMTQVGADFSAGVSPQNPGDFLLTLGNFYDPNSPQPRVPWPTSRAAAPATRVITVITCPAANLIENTRDSNDNLDGIRLRQAYRIGDNKATPIVPTNKRFAEPEVPNSFNGFLNPGAGNPQLYRVSTGHGGVMCEGCHGATHAEWPNANDAANDNQTAKQLQGHAGTIADCTTCHSSSPGNNLMVHTDCIASRSIARRRQAAACTGDSWETTSTATARRATVGSSGTESARCCRGRCRTVPSADGPS